MLKQHWAKSLTILYTMIVQLHTSTNSALFPAVLLTGMLFYSKLWVLPWHRRQSPITVDRWLTRCKYIVQLIARLHLNRSEVKKIENKNKKTSENKHNPHSDTSEKIKKHPNLIRESLKSLSHPLEIRKKIESMFRILTVPEQTSWCPQPVTCSQIGSRIIQTQSNFQTLKTPSQTFVGL